MPKDASAWGGITFAILFGVPLILFGIVATAFVVLSIPALGFIGFLLLGVTLAFLFAGAFAVMKGWSAWKGVEVAA